MKRQLSDSEKQAVLDQHGRRCFVDGELIPDGEPVEFHHIIPFSEEGPTSPHNIAPVCARHHRTIGTMSLQEYRDKLELERFFEDGAPKYLDDVIKHKGIRHTTRIPYETSSDTISLYFDDSKHDYPLYICPTTKWHYFYANLPTQAIANDNDLQPRALRVGFLWNLYRHFQKNTQLAPSICRIDESDTILLFDGQHKAAAQIWAGRRMVECKIYLRPDPQALKETNLEAHSAFRQMAFYSHELMDKYAGVFGEDWDEFMTTDGEKSEAGFFKFLVNAKGKRKSQARNEMTLAMYKRILDDPGNKLAQYLSEKNRARKQPLSFSRLRKSFFQYMVVPVPTKDEFGTDGDRRSEEERNLVKLMSIVAEEGLDGHWNPERADSGHRKAERIFSAGAVRAWVILLRDAINAHLHHYTEEQRQRFIYREISDAEFIYFRQFVRRIFTHKLWDDPDPSGEIAARLAKDDATTAKGLFDEKGLTVSYVLGP